jgi:hypothetical protein
VYHFAEGGLMSNHHRHGRFGRSSTCAAAFTLVALLAACGGSGDSAASDADLANPMKGPMAELFGWDMSPADQRAKELEAQQVMVECMKAEGWEYKPVDYSAGSGFNDEYADMMADPVAYGEKYGYGVVRGFDMQEEMNDSGAPMPEDPNSEYVNSLSMDEQNAYYEALYGAMSEEPMIDEVDESGDTAMPAMESTGCNSQAYDEVYGDQLNDPDINDRLNQMFEDSQNDPALKAANATWAECMTEIDPSYEWASPDDISTYLYDKFNTAQGYGPMSDGSEPADTIAMTEESTSGEGVPGFELPEVDQAAIDDLRVEELQIWADDQTCQGKSDLLQVRRDVEQRMVDDLLAEFPELGEK